MSKKFTSLLVLATAMLLAVPTQAQVAKKQAPASKKFEAHKMVSPRKTVAMEKAVDAYKAMKASKEETQVPLRAKEDRNAFRPFAFSAVPQAPLKILKATGEVADAHGIITKPGDGVQKVYTRTGQGYKYASGSSTLVEQSGEAQIVECEDGTIYFKDIVSTYASGAWVKGTKSGNTITVPTKQPVSYNSDYNATLSVRWGTGDGTANVTAADDIAENFTFIVDETAGTISLQNTTATQFMAVLWDDDNSYSGNGVFETVYTYAHDYVAPTIVTVTPPAGLTTATWYTQGDTYSSSTLTPFRGEVTVGFDGSDVYLKGIFSNFPEAWMKGTIEGSTVTFKDLQVQGTSGTYTIYGVGTDGSNLQDFTMTYDAEAGKLTSVNYLLANAAEDRVFYMTFIYDITITKDAPAEEVAETGAPVDVIPYENKFETAEEQAQFGIIDSNFDGSTWTFEKDAVSGSDGSARYKWSSSNDGNDWLISPAIKLTAGVKYRVAFDTRSQSSYNAERVELKMGKEAKASALTEQVIAATDVAWNTAYETLENEEFTVAEDGYYHFGIHAISDADSYYLWVDNFVVELGLKPGAPAAPAIEVISGNVGDLTATVKVTAPTKNAGEEDLTENISKIEILRNGEVVGQLTDVAPGAMKRFFDEPATAGTYTYQAVPYNSVGKGVKSEKVSLYVGVDVPADLEEVNAVDNGTSVTFSWTPVGNVGANGGYVDPTTVKYGIWTTELVSFWGFTWLDLAEKIGEATGTGSATVEFNTEEGDQQSMEFAVQPTNEMGAGTEAYADALLIGKSYELPFNEGFAGKTLHYYWSSNAFLGVSEEATDDDGVSLTLATQDASQPVYLISGKININNTVNPTLLFDAKSANVSQLYVLGAKDGGQFDVLQTVSLTAANQTVKIPLTSLAGGRYVQFALLAQYTTPLTADDEGNILDWGDNIVIDAIRVVDLYQYNLGVSIAAPASVVAGQKAAIKATVENKGENAAEGYSIVIKAGDKELLNETVTEALAPFKNAEYTAELETTIFDEAGDVAITAEVTYENDLEPDDNKTDAIITVKEPTAPAPEGLTATDKGDAGVDLAWSAPSVSATETTDDVESYADFDNGGVADDQGQSTGDTGAIGEWTVFNGNAGSWGYGFNGTQTTLGDQVAFQVFNPGAVSASLAASYPAHSGDKYFISACTAEPEGAVAPTNHWLISPELPGVAQTVKFYVRELVADYGAETFEILASSTDNKPESFTVVESKSTSSTEWEEVSADLPAGTKFFAIHHTSTDVWALLVDDITFLVGGANVASYNIYYEGELIATVTGDVTTYTVAANKIQAGNHTFSVTAVYANGSESKPISVQADVTTGIQKIATDGKPVDVYALDGKLVRQQTKSLDGLKGVYVINGKKVMIK
ncbi:MAG: hypothetical protein IJ633_01475 [Prevotella sp.]|nr:hypothetical protein [Prevotella sp.]